MSSQRANGKRQKCTDLWANNRKPATNRNYFLHDVSTISGDFRQSQRVAGVVRGHVRVADELELSVPHVELELGTTVLDRFRVFLLERRHD